MSTIQFDHRDIQELRAFLDLRGTEEWISVCLQTLCNANAKAYSDRYAHHGEKFDPVIVKDLKPLLSLTKAQKLNAISTLSMMPYNCDDLFSDPEVLRAYSELSRKALRNTEVTLRNIWGIE